MFIATLFANSYNASFVLRSIFTYIALHGNTLFIYLSFSSDCKFINIKINAPLKFNMLLSRKL